ncbi:kinesin-like protein KIF12 isoform X2 [Nilaparvata lugens]|uniref:kinesin-like protein KIF12 isoform X2 n=1 Tax=Nilaparvata lugens TaxID=108931 RepID=UPI00193CFC2B|nr:kinesin-like protein KIF12 isoform X2 [Nilaparvata lugens]
MKAGTKPVTKKAPKLAAKNGSNQNINNINNNNNVNNSNGNGNYLSSGSSSDSRRGISPSPPSVPRSRGSDDSFPENSNGSVYTDSIVPEDNINVTVRVRPLNPKEMGRNDPNVVQFPGNGQILLEGLNSVPGCTGNTKLFSFNVVFEPGATQEDIFQFSGIKRLIEMAVAGFSTTCFCYGQTGSGKTHTLTGPPGLFDRNPDPYSENHGLVFRSFMHLFRQLQERPETHFVLKASFLEIYNEKVIDLLNPGSARKPLAVRWSKKTRGFFVENLFTVDCEELDDLLAVLEEGMRNRSVGSHSMNEHSSRSHTILTVNIVSETQMENGVFISKQGKINFVDLAGSEMTKKTHSEGKTLEEANNINKSLMVLGYCIASLSDSKKKGGHIPYRDSKLTKLLADSLAGSGVTLMIACISPAKSNLTETLNTLRYAARAKKIRTKPIIVMDPREALILSLKREVSALQNENEHLRHALHLAADPNRLLGSKVELRTPPNIDLERVAEMDGAELAELVRHYATENEALRHENAELFSTRELLFRDQELVCRENERLLKKLEDVNSSSSEVWTNPINGSSSGSLNNINGHVNGMHKTKDKVDGRMSPKPPHRLPDSIQKELDKLQIGKTLDGINESIKKRASRKSTWENGKAVKATGVNGVNGKDGVHHDQDHRHTRLPYLPGFNAGTKNGIRRIPSVDNIYVLDKNNSSHNRIFTSNHYPKTDRSLLSNSVDRLEGSGGGFAIGSAPLRHRSYNSLNNIEYNYDAPKKLSRDPFGSLISLSEEDDR